MIVLLVCILVEILIFYGLYKMLQSLKIKRGSGFKLTGRRVDYMEIPGRPTRYKISVEFVLNEVSRKFTIITSDRNARRFLNDEDVPLIYFRDSDKVFWAEESDNMRIFTISVLGIIAFMLLVIIMYGILGKLIMFISMI